MFAEFCEETVENVIDYAMGESCLWMYRPEVEEVQYLGDGVYYVYLTDDSEGIDLDFRILALPGGLCQHM